jgi:hypothetical protein
LNRKPAARSGGGVELRVPRRIPRQFDFSRISGDTPGAMKLLRQFGERMLAWTIIVVLGAIVLLILDLLGYD